MQLHTLALLTVLAALVVVGARLGFSNFGSLLSRDSTLRALVETGAPFIAIGALLGPQILNLLSAELQQEINVLVILGFGVIGLLYGSHFEGRRLRRFGFRMYAAAMIESIFTLAVVTFVCWQVIPLFHVEAFGHIRIAMSLAMGACAAGTAPAGVFLLTAERQLPRADLQVLRFFAAVDDWPALFALAVVFSLSPVVTPATPWVGVYDRLLLPVGLGFITGLIAHWIFPSADDDRHNTLVLLGAIATGGGSATLLGVSPLLVGVIGGVVFANLSPRKESAYGLLVAREHSLYAMFLLLSGAMFTFGSGRTLWLFVPGYVAVRAFAKIVGTYIARKIFLPFVPISGLLGVGLLSQGGMPLVFAVHFDLSLGGPMAHLVMTTLVFAVVINDIVASPIANLALRKKRFRQ